jgi:hypothetical protein
VISRELPKFSVDPLQTRDAGQYAARVSQKARLTLGRRFRRSITDETVSLERGSAIMDSIITISASENICENDPASKYIPAIRGCRRDPTGESVSFLLQSVQTRRWRDIQTTSPKTLRQGTIPEDHTHERPKHHDDHQRPGRFRF